MTYRIFVHTLPDDKIHKFEDLTAQQKAVLTGQAYEGSRHNGVSHKHYQIRINFPINIRQYSYKIKINFSRHSIMPGNKERTRQ